MLPPNSNRDMVLSFVTQIWTETLKVSSIAPDDNFFKLGGTSFLAGKILTRIKTETGIETLKLKHFLASPSVAGLVDLIERHGAESK